MMKSKYAKRRNGKLILAAVGVAQLTLVSHQTRADINWDGDAAVGDFTDNFNWYGNAQPTWGFGSGNLVFNYRNSTNQTSLYYNYGQWRQINDIIWETTFGAGLTLNGDGNGIDFNQRIENRSSFAQVVNIPLSGAKNGAAQIELNPVNGALTISGTIANDNSKPYYVYGNNGKNLTLNTTLGVGATPSAVSFNLMQHSVVVMNAAQSYTGDTNINAGTLQFNSGGSAASSILRLGDTSGTAAANLALGAAGGGQTLGSMLVVRSGSSGAKTLYSSNTNTNTWSGSVFLDADLNVTQSGAGFLAFTGTTFDLKNQTATFNVNDGTVTIANAMGSSAGTGNLRKFGAGYLALSSNSNTLTGAVTIEEAVSNGSSGVVIVSANNALGTSATVNLRNIQGLTGNQNNNAELRIAGVTVPSGVSLNVTSGSATDRRTTLSNSIGSGAWNGPITLTSSHTQTFAIASNGTDFVIGNAVTASAGATGGLWIRGSGSGTITGNVSLNSTELLQKLDAGTWALNGSVTGSGLNVASGVLRITSPIQTALSGTASLGVNGNGALLEANGSIARGLGTTSGSFSLSGGTVSAAAGVSARGGALGITIGTANSVLPMGTLALANCTFTSGTGSIQVASTSGLAVGMLLSGTNIPANAAITAIGTGTITIGSVTTGAGSAVSVSFGAVSTGFSGTLAVPTLTLNSSSADGDLALNNGLDIRLAGLSTRTISVGAKTATITGAISNGVAGGTGTLSRAGTGTLVMNGGGTGFDMLYLPSGRTDLGGTWTLNRIATSTTASRDVNINGTVNLTMKDFNAQFVGDQTATGVVNFNINAGGALSIDRTGSNERDFAIANGAGSNDATAVFVNVAGTFTLKSAVNMIGIGGSTRATSRASGATLTINSGGLLDIQGTPASTNKIYLGAANNINGGGTPTAATVQAGTLVLNTGGSLRTSRTITEGAESGNITSGRLYFSGGTLSATAATDNTDWISGLTTAAVRNGGAVIDSNGSNMTISQSLTPDTGSTGGLAKWGNGKLTLSGTNSYTGTTTVSAGTLLVNGTHSGGDNYTVSANATLGGTGQINLGSSKTVTVNGVLAPGASIGNLSGDTNFTLNSSSLFRVEIDPSGGTVAGTDNDVVTLTGANAAAFTVNGGQLQLDLIGTFGTVSLPKTYRIVNATGTNKGVTVTSAFSNLTLVTGVYKYSQYNVKADVTFGGKYIDVTLTSVPEPASLSLVVLGIGALCSRRRSRAI